MSTRYRRMIGKTLSTGWTTKVGDFTFRSCLQISSGTYRNSYAIETVPLSLGKKYTNHETDRTTASNSTLKVNEA
jgi:hypothetical protein